MHGGEAELEKERLKSRPILCAGAGSVRYGQLVLSTTRRVTRYRES